ncbi:TPR and ankyrin repeat-containing protein 1-like [Saccostrea cucullata]|uniref:TPR and ankyrin repeat-containing protein 1-like n=1 Tax=Saccostrea cuccullata TaxID=36930 RepID=UPI002ED0EC5D
MKQACRAWRGSCSPRQQDLPQRLQDVEDYQYPLFLTFKQLLKVLDISLGCPFYLAKDDMTMDIQGWADSLNNGDLSKFRDTDLDIEDLLEDELANDEEVREESDTSRCSNLKSGRKPRDAFSRKLLTYEVFEELFWNKIKGKKSECHQSLVWTEIMSFIKGSFQALLSPTGYLDLKQYKELGKKMAPVFTNDREKIYEMFLIYERAKKQLFYIDEADVARNIFQRVTIHEIPDLLAHEIYVDETQDFTQAELCILVRLCQTPKGLFLTGDTAQCIMRGISFRFEDLRSLFHQIREISERNINVPEKLFHLTHNYRSHAGILNLASGILEILKEFFPESYDHLERDVGMIDGPKPVILKQSDSKDLILLLAGNKRKTSSIELGAHQVILVASEETKEKIQTEFNKCLVMTIDRAKGLEFDDVLIYNFFKESSATKEWRVVKQFLKKMSKSRNSDRANVHIGLHEYQHSNLVPNTEVRPLEFDPRKHKVLCTELKVLYTAITRARSNVWVFDEDKESRAPMYEYFAARNLVDIRDDSSARGFSQPSACSEWLLRGNYFFRKSHFDEAAKCYENAGHSRGAEYASARHHQQQARCAEKSKKKHHLLAAALRFFNCNNLKNCISCLKSASEFEILAVFYEGRNEIDEAAEMYGRAGMPIHQSKCLENIEYFGKALKVLINSANFDPGLECVKRFKSHGISKDEIPEDLSDEKQIYIKAMKYCGKTQNIPKMVGYAERIDDFKTKFEIFLEYDNVEEAFNLKYGKADVVEKIDFFLKCGAASKALILAIENDPENKNKQIQIQCIVLMAQRAIYDKDNKDERNIRKIVDHLNTLISPEETSENIIYTGKAQLLIGQLTKNSNFVKTAFQTFKKEKHAGFFGQLECIEWLINNIDLLAFSNIERIIMHIKETVSSLDKEMNIAADLKLWYEFYGYYKDKATPSYKIYPRQCPLAAKISQTKELFEDSLDANNVQTCCLKFWEKRYRTWEDILLRNLYKRKDTTKGFLKRHFEEKGIIWREGEKQNTPDCGRNPVLHINQLNMMSVELLACLNILDPWKDQNMTERCKTFISDLFYTDPLETTTVEIAVKHGLSKLLHDKRFSNFREEIMKYFETSIRHLDTESKSIGKSIEILLVKIALGFEDLEITDMQQFQKSFENDVKKVNVHRILLTFFNSFDNLRKENIVSAVQSFDTFCALLSASEKQQLPVIPEILILFNELFASVAFCSVACARNESFVLPDSFLASVKYAEHLFLGSKSIFETLKKNPPPDSTFMLHSLLQMLCGFSCKMNLIKMSSKLSSGIVDRILLISFIILYNVNIIPITEQTYEIESVLVKELLDLLESKKRKDVLKSIIKATNSSDFIETLQIILRPGNDLKVCRWDGEKCFTTCTGTLNVKGVPLRKETLEAIEAIKKKEDKSNPGTTEKKDQAIVCPEDKKAYSLAFPELPRPFNALERKEL